ncbi:protein bcn92 [Apis dorsata]|uniref:protein bcn92 n=1 Tax=Apis dorsata TaxID=7462 RepID=UPI0003DF7335|nr:protein bcn92 [Apis dorsata]
MASRKDILNLYRNLIRETKKWNLYNFRMYTLRKIRYEFQQNKTVQDKKKINEYYNKGLENLEIIKRQVIIGNLYTFKPLIIETIKKNNNLN